MNVIGNSLIMRIIMRTRSKMYLLIETITIKKTIEFYIRI